MYFLHVKARKNIILLTSNSIQKCKAILKTDQFFIVYVEYQGTKISLIMKIQSHP